MKVLLVNPGWPRDSLWDIKFFRTPPYSLAVISALTPDEHDIMILDENVEKANYMEIEADVVGITVMTPLAPRSYEIAQFFKDRGIPVIFGGIHPTLLPEEPLIHGDSVIIGEAENLWPKAVNDVESGSLKRVYRCEGPSVEDIQGPRPNLFRKDAYFLTNLVQTTRGCPHHCDFCAISAIYRGKYRTRPIDDVMAEINEFDGKNILFVDDNIVSNTKYAKELFDHLIPLNKQWYSQCSLTIALDDELLKLASESGCKGLFIGFESVSEASIKEIHKINLVRKYKSYVHKIQDYGIAIEGAFVFGFDNDDKEIFQKTIDFCHDLDLDAAQFGVLTPYPGTRLYQRLDDSGRILTYDWSRYDATHVVFEPRNMSVQELYDGVYSAYDQFYSLRSIFTRFLHTNFSIPFFFMINLGFRSVKNKIQITNRHESIDQGVYDS